MEQGSQSSDGVHISSPILDNPNLCEEQEKAMRRAEWAAVRERNLANGNIPTKSQSQAQTPPSAQKTNSKDGNLTIQHSIIIAAIIIGLAIVIAAFMGRSSGGARYKVFGINDGLILDTRTGDVQRAADKLENK